MSEASRETARKIDDMLQEGTYDEDEVSALIDADKRELVEALEELMDTQNGPPLIREATRWGDAMRKCHQALTRHTPTEDTTDERETPST